MISRIFRSKFWHIYIISVSGHWMHFIFKTCQNVVGISMICEFNEFFKCNFWRVFALRINCAQEGRADYADSVLLCWAKQTWWGVRAECRRKSPAQRSLTLSTFAAAAASAAVDSAPVHTPDQADRHRESEKRGKFKLAWNYVAFSRVKSQNTNSQPSWNLHNLNRNLLDFIYNCLDFFS